MKIEKEVGRRADGLTLERVAAPFSPKSVDWMIGMSAHLTWSFVVEPLETME